MYKTIYFFKLDIRQSMTNDKFISESCFFNIFDKRFNSPDVKINKNDSIWTEYKSCKVDNNLIVDILVHNSNYFFGTIGCTKSENRLRRIRNIKDLSHHDLRLGDDNILEDYTFFFLDYTTGIISVLNTKGAPDIKTLKKLLYKDANLTPEILPIKNRNIHKKLKTIREVGGVEFQFALSPNKLLGKGGEGLDYALLKQFNKDGFERCSMSFFLDRKNPERKSPESIINDMLNTYTIVKDNEEEYSIEKLGLLATPEDEHQQLINLLELYFTKGINIKVDENFSESSILKILEIAYNNIKADLLENVKLHT